MSRHHAPLPAASAELFRQASSCLAEALATGQPGRRYAAAHLAALRCAAAVLAVRARPTDRRSQPIRSAWVLLSRVAPELAEWAAFFASGAGKRAAAEAGLPHAVSQRDADDLIRAVLAFRSLCQAAARAAGASGASGAVAAGVAAAGGLPPGAGTAGWAVRATAG
ncbi:MAG: hypothetical protein L0Y54_10165 [Sporichthyaceae bacterium]|nr:hypothetical protein [Sporichthyaceae bacterium]